MELQIQDLISAIKKEGMDTAREEGDRLLAEAKQKASELIAEAKEEAGRIRESTRQEVELMKESVKVTAEHARRDALLCFRKAVQTELAALLADGIARAVDDRTLAKLILAAVQGEDPARYVAEAQEVTAELKGALAEKIKAGLELRVNDRIRTGFRLVWKDGSGYLDCSDEELTELLKPFFPDLTL